MRRLIGTVVIGSLFAIGYVLVNGIGDDYQLFGDAGPVLSGVRIILAAVAMLAGLVAIGSGLRNSRGSVLVGVILLVGAGWALSAPQPEHVLASDSIPHDEQAAAVCYQLLEDEPTLRARLLTDPDKTATTFANGANPGGGAHWSDAYKGCLAGLNLWVAENLW